MLQMSLRAAALFAFLLLPATVMAQSRTFSITMQPSPGDTVPRVVMDEVSALTFDVTNTSNNNSRRITRFDFVLPAGYIPQPSTAPAGWTVTPDVPNRRVTVATPNANNTNCNNDPGLVQNGVLRITLRFIPAAAAADVPADAFVTGTTARDTCPATDFITDLAAPGATWVRSGLSTSVSVRPSALGIGRETDAYVVIENRTTQPHGGVTVTAPTTGTSGVGLQVVSTLPASASVPLGGAGVFSARWRATAGGTAVAQVRATQTTGAVSSGFASTQVLDVEPLAVSVDVNNLQIAPGTQIQVRATVTNSSAT
ncbi:MAG TPA: dehydrogenase, partial [Myxococcus sp.]|nr:dehydrogenase [Myxococcus sp.]